MMRRLLIIERNWPWLREQIARFTMNEKSVDVIRESVNFKTNTLTVKGETAKSAHTRHIPLNLESRDVLKAWRNQSGREGLLFKSRDGGKLDNMKKSWAGVLKAANITGFRWHDLRHHFASRLTMAGADLYTVKDLLGHSTIAMTEKYAHLAPSHVAAAVALLDGKK